jgi:hypothetical protein
MKKKIERKKEKGKRKKEREGKKKKEDSLDEVPPKFKLK